MAQAKLKLCTCLWLVFNSIIVISIFSHRRKDSNQRLAAKCLHWEFENAAVAADSKECSDIGRDTLMRGGSAVDAAIAALICTSVIYPQCMGIGGGSIFTIRDKNGNVTIINSRETVPNIFNPHLMSECSNTTFPSAKWIGVPGEIRGYAEAHRRYGKLSWESLFQPTIKLARKGITLSHVLSKRIEQKLTKINKTFSIRKLFSNINGTLLKEGDLLRFDKLADTLEIIAKEGEEAFYSGEIARNLISDIKEENGTLSMEDLSSYHVQVLDPWKMTLGDYDMYIPPPPFGGAVLDFILNTMRGYNLTAASFEDQQKTITYHRFVETLKFASGLKKFLRDPRFTSPESVLNATTEEYAEATRAKIHDNWTNNSQCNNVTPSLDSIGTSHLSVLAEDGMAVSVTSTINRVFGSGIYSPKTGIILNNELMDFCQKASSIQTGEQPPSSMSPTILYSKSKNHMMIVGGSGGDFITTGLALAIMKFLWMGKSLNDSISEPVVYVDSECNVSFEPEFDKVVEKNLKSFGNIVVTKEFYNVVNAVSKRDGCITAWSDKRKNGTAAGY